MTMVPAKPTRVAVRREQRRGEGQRRDLGKRHVRLGEDQQHQPGRRGEAAQRHHGGPRGGKTAPAGADQERREQGEQEDRPRERNHHRIELEREHPHDRPVQAEAQRRGEHP
jgi:hypothetical protein